MSHTMRVVLPLVVLFFITALFAGCGTEPSQNAAPPALETRADSVAMRLLEALGGAEAWASVPYLRFDFAVERGGTTQGVAKHLWDRQTGAYRVEWRTSPDSQYVALLDVDAFGQHASESAPDAGQVYLNGTAVDAETNTSLIQRAHQRFVNDSYWLLAPVKVFDPGVNRSYVPDSSNARHDVIRLTFGNVGLTPGDRYWLYVNRETGRLDRWFFHLQGMSDEAPPRMASWTDYRSFEVPAGSVHIAARKPTPGSETAIVFPTLDVPASVPDDAFTNPEPQL